MTAIADTGKTQTVCKTAYAAALILTERKTRHFAVDAGATLARQRQRQFAGAVNRLVRLLMKKIDGAKFTIRFLDARPSSMACSRDLYGEYDLAAQIIITRDDRIIHDVAVKAHGKALRAYIQQTEFPHRNCRAVDGKTLVYQSPISKVMSVHANRIVATPFAVYAS